MQYAFELKKNQLLRINIDKITRTRVTTFFSEYRNVLPMSPREAAEHIGPGCGAFRELPVILFRTAGVHLTDPLLQSSSSKCPHLSTDSLF